MRLASSLRGGSHAVGGSSATGEINWHVASVLGPIRSLSTPRRVGSRVAIMREPGWGEMQRGLRGRTRPVAASSAFLLGSDSVTEWKSGATRRGRPVRPALRSPTRCRRVPRRCPQGGKGAIARVGRCARG